jgi:hypothetical protein
MALGCRPHTQLHPSSFIRSCGAVLTKVRRGRSAGRQVQRRPPSAEPGSGRGCSGGTGPTRPTALGSEPGLRAPPATAGCTEGGSDPRWACGPRASHGSVPPNPGPWRPCHPTPSARLTGLPRLPPREPPARGQSVLPEPTGAAAAPPLAPGLPRLPLTPPAARRKPARPRASSLPRRPAAANGSRRREAARAPWRWRTARSPAGGDEAWGPKLGAGAGERSAAPPCALARVAPSAPATWEVPRWQPGGTPGGGKM